MAREQDVDDEQRKKRLLDRRGYLKMGATAAAIVGTTGMARNAFAQTERHGIQFDTRLDAVDDLGMDPTGGDPIDGALSNAIDDSTLIEFPEGTYRTEKEHNIGSVSNFGLRGLGSNKNDVRIQRGGSSGLMFMAGWQNPVENVLFENFTFDQTDDKNTAFGHIIHILRNFQMRDIEFAGFSPADYNGGVTDWKLHVHDPDGVAVVKNYDDTDPSDIVDHPDGEMSFYIGGRHEGTFYFQNCDFANCASHTMYATRNDGDVRVENCSFKNNQNTNTRIAGSGSYVKDSTYVLDPSDAHPDNTYSDGAGWKMRGIWWESGDWGHSGGYIENCEIRCDGPKEGGPIIDVRGDTGGLAIRDTTIENNVDGKKTVRGQPLQSSFSSPDLTIDGCTITGSGGHDQVVSIYDDRDGSVVKNSCINMTKSGQDGVRIENTSNCELSDVNINVDGQATVFQNADVSTSELTQNETCSTTSSTSDDTSTTTTTTSTSDTWSELVIEGNGKATYEFSVSGDLEPYADGGVLSGPDSISGSSASGVVYSGGSDGYRFTGEVTSFTLDGDATVYRNGEQVSPSELSTDTTTTTTSSTSDDTSTTTTTTSTSDTWSELVIEGNGKATYEFSVSGDLEPYADGGVLSGPDSISGSSASGVVYSGGSDGYRFTGTMKYFEVDGPVTVYLDGEEVAPENLGLPNSIVFDGSVLDSVTDYQFSVTGEVYGSADLGTLEDGDSVTQTSVDGSVASGKDGYRFSGDLSKFDVDGSAKVLLTDTDG